MKLFILYLKYILLFIYQLPQNLVGLIVILVCKAKKETHYGITIWVSPKYRFGVSLGDFIIISKNDVDEDTVKHEHGHQIQSLMSSWLYLLCVGLPSAARNLYDRFFHKEWKVKDRLEWYYGSFPEKQADEYGDVNRQI